MANERVGVIDGLRGLAILLVLFFHVYLKSHFSFAVSLFGVHASLRTLTQAGNMGVEIFFFVSGFCLMLPYARYLQGRASFQSWREYASRRFWKIVPSYYLALAVIALWFPFDARAGVNRAWDVALHASFLHSFDPTAFTSLNSNFWSLAVEVQFYLVFPFVVLGFLRWPWRTSVAVVALGALYSSWIASTGRDGVFVWSYDLLGVLPLFAIGALTAYAYERWVRDARLSARMRHGASALSVLTLAALIVCLEMMDRLGGGPIVWQWANRHRILLALLLALFTLFALAGAPWWQAAVGNRVLRFYSDISYNMYLWNAAVVALLSSHWWHGSIEQFAAASLLGASAMGVLLTYAFERPLMRRRWSLVFAPLSWWERWRHETRESNA